MNTPSEIIFLIDEHPDRGYSASALGESIFAAADNLNQLHAHVREAVECHFEEEYQPKIILK